MHYMANQGQKSCPLNSKIVFIFGRNHKKKVSVTKSAQQSSTKASFWFPMAGLRSRRFLANLAFFCFVWRRSWTIFCGHWSGRLAARIQSFKLLQLSIHLSSSRWFLVHWKANSEKFHFPKILNSLDYENFLFLVDLSRPWIRILDKTAENHKFFSI